MAGILGVANVIRGDGGWTRGLEFDAYGCVLSSKIDEICASPATPIHLSGPDWTDDSNVPSNDPERAPVFAVSDYLQARLMCHDDGGVQVVTDALDAESEKAVGKVLELGQSGNNVNLHGPAVTTVAAGATPAASLAKALKKLWDIATGVGAEETIVHLGIDSAFALLEARVLDDETLQGIKAKVAISPGYTPSLIAVTGPVEVHLGDTEFLDEVNFRDNTSLPYASRLASVQFDPCLAVRVA